MTYLDDILARRRRAVADARSAQSIEELMTAALSRIERRDFAACIASGKHPALIAEFKRSSPSAGAINSDADPRTQAAAYARGGSAALSVLTEPDLFSGSFDDLRAARDATTLPVLCKDFVVDEYQIWEAVAHSADAILLIVAALGDPELARLIVCCRALRVMPLVEVHDEAEVDRAAAAGATAYGVNNRDLRTFEVDTDTALRLRERIPGEALIVAESGYRTAAEIARCGAAGIHAVLVGEPLMRTSDPERVLADLRGAHA